jgi:hypothetical protein
VSDATFPESWPEDSMNHIPSRKYRRRQHDAARATYGDGRAESGTPPAAPLNVRSPEFRAAVKSVFEAPGEWGPAKGYYGRDIDHFIDMLDNRLSDSKEPPTGKEGE